MQSTVKLPFKNDITSARGIRNTQELLANHVKFQLAEGLFENKKPFVLQNSNQYFSQSWFTYSIPRSHDCHLLGSQTTNTEGGLTAHQFVIRREITGIKLDARMDQFKHFSSVF